MAAPLVVKCMPGDTGANDMLSSLHRMIWVWGLMESYSADSLQHECKLMISSVVISFSYTEKYVTYFMVQDAS
jgi:hypothetical protein